MCTRAKKSDEEEKTNKRNGSRQKEPNIPCEDAIHKHDLRGEECGGVGAAEREGVCAHERRAQGVATRVGSCLGPVALHRIVAAAEVASAAAFARELRSRCCRNGDNHFVGNDHAELQRSRKTRRPQHRLRRAELRLRFRFPWGSAGRRHGWSAAAAATAAALRCRNGGCE